MAKNTDQAWQFINECAQRAGDKHATEVAAIKNNLPDEVGLLANGKFNPWDFIYCKNQYKKNHLAVDDAEVAQYFPMEHTLNALLEVYSKFFDVTFTQKPLSGLWSNDLTLVSMHKNGVFRGSVILDLYPREGKFTHACCGSIIHAQRLEDGSCITPVVVVITNFAKPTAQRPSLLTLDQVRTFFHEFGHAVHNLFGCTQLNTFSGTQVKRDFVEMPSQMLEEWLNDKDILRMISCHYQTGKCMPDELINKIIALAACNSALFLMRQLSLSALSLHLYSADTIDSVHEIAANYSSKFTPDIQQHPELDHYTSAFGHLPEYAASYYGYMWSLVYALDMFATIKGHGLLDKEIGEHYRACILAPGGSKDPMDMITEFLGRKPNSKAFFDALCAA